jgi:hypothetical protein
VSAKYHGASEFWLMRIAAIVYFISVSQDDPVGGKLPLLCSTEPNPTTMDISFMLLGAVAFVVAARYTTPSILRHMAVDGIFHARCTGHPDIDDASVNVRADGRQLILSTDTALALILRNDIRRVTIDRTNDGLPRVSILWGSLHAESFTTLTFLTQRDAQRVARLIH